MRTFVTTVALGACALLSATLASAASAQPAANVPRTPQGRPDFQGVWLSGFLTPLERPDGIATLVVAPEDEAAAIAILVEYFDEGEVYDPEADANPIPRALLEIDGELRSSWIVAPTDGKLPLTALASAVMDAPRTRFDHPEDRPTTERCVAGFSQAPMSAGSLPIPIRIVQTPDAIVVAAEDMNPARIIALSGRAPPDVMRTPDGYSRGRWEGETLIVETTHYSSPDPTSGVLVRSAAPLTADSKVIERFRMRSANELHYQFTIEDPSLYRQPWLAEFVLRKVDMGFFEYACHEANHSIINILTAARLGLQEDKPD